MTFLQSNIKTFVLALAAVATVAVPCQQSEAGPILNWLRGRREAYRPVVVQQPVVAGYAPQACCGQGVTAYSPVAPVTAYRPMVAYRPAYRTAYQPVSGGGGLFGGRGLFGCCGLFGGRTAYRPVTAYQPIAQPACPCPTPCATACPQQCTVTQRVCCNVPQTTYRTEYVQVPVTTYRPVTSVDPCTGCSTTCMQPCQTTRLQARRVPVTTYRQVCSLQQVPMTVNSPIVSTPACGNCGTCNSCTNGSAVLPQTQQFVQPSTSLAPSTGLQPQPTVVPNAGQEAAQQPQLPVIPQYQGSSYQSTPQHEFTQHDTQVQTERPSYDGFDNDVTTQQQPARSRDLYVPRVQVPTIRPLPDLDRQQEVQPPALLNPDDRTAARPASHVIPAGAITPINWSSLKQVQPAAAKAQPARTAPAAKPTATTWSANSWRAAK